jgi:hypothetical protein
VTTSPTTPHNSNNDDNDGGEKKPKACSGKDLADILKVGISGLVKGASSQAGGEAIRAVRELLENWPTT